MAASKQDPTVPIALKASRFPGVAEGTSCTQSSFKVGKTAFLYLGKQGGRYKAMFKLGASRSEAEELAKEHPENYQVGSTSWVTARFDAAQPMPKRLWTRWLDESYALSVGGTPAPKKSAVKKRATKKKVTKKKATKKKATKKKTPRT